MQELSHRLIPDTVSCLRQLISLAFLGTCLFLQYDRMPSIFVALSDDGMKNEILVISRTLPI